MLPFTRIAGGATRGGRPKRPLKRKRDPDGRLRPPEPVAALPPDRVNCPNLDTLHMERECLDGGAILHGLPQRTRRATNITLLTIFRHPFERIGSQAFYGSTAINNRLKRGDPRGLDRSGFVPTSYKEAVKRVKLPHLSKNVSNYYVYAKV